MASSERGRFITGYCERGALFYYLIVNMKEFL